MEATKQGPKRNRKPKSGQSEHIKHTLHEYEENKHDHASEIKIFDYLEADQALLDKIANPNAVIKHITIGISAAFKDGSKNLIADALKRSYHSLALKIQWIPKNAIITPKQVGYALRIIEMVAAADVIESEICIYLEFCQPDKQAAERLAKAFAKVSHLKSFKLMDTTEIFGLAVIEKIADAKNNLQTFLIRKKSEFLCAFEEDLTRALCTLITQKTTLEQLDLLNMYDFRGHQYWQMMIDCAVNSNIRYINAPRSTFSMNTLTNLFAHAKKLTVFNAESCTILCDTKDFFGLKDNTTLRALDIQKTTVDLDLLPDVLRSNTTLQSLKFSLEIHQQHNIALYKRILEALKENKTLWCFECTKKGMEFLPHSHEAHQTIMEMEYDVAQISQSLRKFNDLDTIFVMTKRAIAAFVILFAKNSPNFTDVLPFELWLKIAYYMNTPGLRDVEKLLLDTVQRIGKGDCSKELGDS